MEIYIALIIVYLMIVFGITGFMHFIPSDYQVLGYIMIVVLSVFFIHDVCLYYYGRWINLNDTHLGRQLMSSNYTTVRPVVLTCNNNEYRIKGNTRLSEDFDILRSKNGFAVTIAPGFTFKVKHIYSVFNPLYERKFEVIIEPISKPIITEAIETEYHHELKLFGLKRVNNFDKYTDIGSKSINLHTPQFFTLDSSGTLEQIGNRTPIIRDNLTRTQLAIA